MTLYVLRALFVLVMAAVGSAYLGRAFGENDWSTLPVAIILALLVLTIDAFSSRRKLVSLSAILFGTLVGMAIAYVLGLAAEWLVGEFVTVKDSEVRRSLVQFLKMMLNIVSCYLVISFILQTRDDVRFIIPYVEFAKQSRGARPFLVDTSTLIDGRVLEMANIGLIDSRIVVPRFVLDELQTLADSADKLKRNRGRRGLDILTKLQDAKTVDVLIYESTELAAQDDQKVDERLVDLASELNGRVMTTDFNLKKVAQLRGVSVMDINDIATAVKPTVIPGEVLKVQLIKPGEQPGQAVGYLDDGTMVVVEQARQYINSGDVEVTVTSTMQTTAGRMVFARSGEAEAPRKGRGREGTLKAQS